MSRELALGAGLLVGGVFATLLAFYVWRRRDSAGGTALFVTLIGIAIWTKCYAIELSTQTVPDAKLWAGLKYVGVVIVPGALWVFVRQYTRRRPISRRTLLLLCIEPVAVLLVLALPWTHDLIHFYRPEDVARGTLPTSPVAQPGPLLWPHAAYSYVLLFVALGTFVQRIGRVGRPYRRQAAVVIVASLAPLVGNALYNLDLLGFGAVDPAPFLFSVFSVVLVWGVFRLRLLDLMPVARGVVVEQMPDGVLVLDAYDRVVDANPAGARLLQLPRDALVGRYAEDLLPQVEGLLADHMPGRTSRDEFPLDLPLAGNPPAGNPPAGTPPAGNPPGGDPPGGDPPGDGPPGDGPPVSVAAWLTSLTDVSGRETGRLLILRDVSDRTAMEWRLRDLLAEQTRLVDTLQAGLRPSSLPEVPGVRIAVRWVPAGSGARVSGDFYDVHQTLGGDHAFVLGDVAGKGVRAAVVTSMTRYTVRTLSAQGWTPRQVLEQLNQALLTEQALLDAHPAARRPPPGPPGSTDPADGERYCTVAYGRIARLDEDAVGDGVLVTLALGGHPQPLVRRRDGTVEPVGSPGTALGLVPTVDVADVPVHLLPGEVLLAYTDGVTEARRDGEQFGEERLAVILSGAAASLERGSGAAAAAAVADAVADRVLDAVRAFSSAHDDIALVALVVA